MTAGCTGSLRPRDAPILKSAMHPAPCSVALRHGGRPVPEQSQAKRILPHWYFSSFIGRVSQWSQEECAELLDPTALPALLVVLARQGSPSALFCKSWAKHAFATEVLFVGSVRLVRCPVECCHSFGPKGIAAACRTSRPPQKDINIDTESPLGAAAIKAAYPHSKQG